MNNALARLVKVLWNPPDREILARIDRVADRLADAQREVELVRISFSQRVASVMNAERERRQQDR